MSNALYGWSQMLAVVFLLWIGGALAVAIFRAGNKLPPKPYYHRLGH